MAGKTKPMSQIKQLLRLHQEGHKIKTIAKILGISKNTVKNYLHKLQSLKHSIDELLQLDDVVLESKFHSGNPAYKDPRFEYLKEHLDYFEDELKRIGVTKQLLWEEYKQDQPSGYGYTQFCHHLNQQLIAKKPSAVLHHKPGEKLFVDFAGKMLSYVDKETGEIIECPVFVACMPHSDYAFAMAVRSQSVEDFIFALLCCLQFFGGVPKILVPDNLKAAIIKASRYEPDINRTLEDFCNHYNITVIPARVKKPKDKALVENQVKIIYTRVYAKLRNRLFFSLSELNEAIAEKMKKHNQTRMQQKPYCREERFLANEKHLLDPLPTENYEIKHYKQLKLGVNNHIYLYCDKHYYSAPYQYIGQQVNVVFTRTIVRIYIHRKMIAMHKRDYRPGKYTTVPEHLCSHHQAYRERSPEYYINQANEKSDILGKVIKSLFDGGRHPEQNYRTCNGLFGLHRETDPEIFERACQEALECKRHSYKFILKIIEHFKLTGLPEAEEQTSLPEHHNIRGKDYYQQ